MRSGFGAAVVCSSWRCGEGSGGVICPLLLSLVCSSSALFALCTLFEYAVFGLYALCCACLLCMFVQSAQAMSKFVSYAVSG